MKGQHPSTKMVTRLMNGRSGTSRIPEVTAFAAFAGFLKVTAQQRRARKQVVDRRRRLAGMAPYGHSTAEVWDLVRTIKTLHEEMLASEHLRGAVESVLHVSSSAGLIGVVPPVTRVSTRLHPKLR